MMVGEGFVLDDVHTAGVQRREEPQRVAYPCESKHVLAAQPID
ncbi:Uncharacterised protein [Mycobacterium tuberculosis]|nr:Uncharacterised protein [Mycobacterium tuberculosis]